jgi:hypothetical protein
MKPGTTTRGDFNSERDILLAGIAPVTPDHDTKLQALAGCIVDKVASPLNEGNRKVLIFSAFTDTAEYLYRELTPRFRSLGLDATIVTGHGNPRATLGKGFGFQHVLTLFSPRLKSRHLVMPDETRELDVLIGTDCISAHRARSHTAVTVGG